MVRLFRVFFEFEGANPWMVVFCLWLASMAQGFSIASLVPLISVMGDSQSQSTSAAAHIVNETLTYIGLSPTIEVLLVVVVLTVALKALLTIVAMIYVARAVANVANGLRARLIRALLKARWSYFISKPTGTLINGVGLEATVSGLLYQYISRLVANTIQGVIYIAVAFFVSWQLATASIFVSILVVVALQVFVRKAEKAGRRGITGARELVTRLGDAIIGIKPLKAMAREDEFGALFEKKVEKIRTATRHEIVSKNMLSSLQDPLVMLLMAAGFYLLIEVFHKPVATVLVMGILLQRTVNTIGKLQTQLQEAVAAESAYQSLRSLIDEAESAREPELGDRQVPLSRECAFRNVTFSYGTTPVLDDLSFDIPARKLTVVIGASGTGKTTMTDILLAFHRPQSGDVYVDGVSLSELDLRSWRQSIGYVPQELILLHDSILANITLGNPLITEAQVWEALQMAGADEFVASLPDGLATEVGEKGAKLSGGQRQRIAIARALVHHPSLLVLDEVTSALDSVTEQQICENIRTIARSMTVLAISHRQAWLDIADHVVTLEAYVESDDAASTSNPRA